jgi:hypothetical protein
MVKARFRPCLFFDSEPDLMLPLSALLLKLPQ